MHVIRWTTVIAVVLVATGTLSAVSACRTGAPGGASSQSIERTRTSGDPYDDCGSDRIEEVVRLANRTRSERGAGALHCAPDLSQVAEAHARDMCENDYLSHRGRDGSTPADRATEAGIEARAFGENIARGQKTPKYAHESWMQSRRHRKNIVREVFSRIGVGYVDCRDRPIWVTVFAN